ncbi:MAG TPA: PIG-L family deacetylase [Ignavibacteria bacterium]|nr:PIG-L family deacetylase [Ignavibacteria bacterium]HMQ99169.1 PIG-L family deacetylase [Ignavibacteria bacterium]
MKKILAIGPHPDDIELGCFGTMAKYKNKGDEVNFLVLTKGEGGTENTNRVEEAIESASLIDANLYIEDLPDRFISEGPETITIVEKYLKQLEPDAVFIPTESDTHQDHRATYNACMVACRTIKEVYAYETPSTSRKFSPNYFVDISDYIGLKVKAVKIHSSQGGKGYMADRAVEGLAEYRAFDILLNDRYVEGFDVIKVIE